MTGMHVPSLLGRADERAAIDRMLAEAATGRSGVLVLRGEAGIGKTALMRYTAQQAASFRVVETSGVEAEMELAYSGIHQLCGPMLDATDALAQPQREALEVALGMASGDVPEHFLVSLAVLSLLSGAAEKQPLLCLIDDAQWLDAASAQILGFVARRLLAEPIALVVAARSSTARSDFDGLPELVLEGLPPDAARTLLVSGVHGPLDDGMRDRIVAETRGNPLALLELPARMTAAELAGGFELPDADELPAHIEHHYMGRIAELPEPTRQLMLLAAADPLGDPALLWRAASRLGIPGEALMPAEEGELLEIADRVVFRHPLVRSAVYGAASDAGRRRAHEALAEVSDAQDDADRRAWHRSLAAAGPDEDIAAELEQSARRAQARGGVAATAALLQRAVVLTLDIARRQERALAAAEATLMAGDFETALGLLAVAEASPMSDLETAQVDLLRARLAFASSRGTDATPLLLAAAGRLEPLDAGLAREVYVDAFTAALFGARLNVGTDVAAVAAAARRAPRAGGEARATADLLLDALVALEEDFAAAVPLCREALQRLAGDTLSPEERMRWLWQGCNLALEIWDDESAYRLSYRAVQLARRTNTLPELALGLSAHTPVLVFCGELAESASRVAEGRAVEEMTGIRSAPYGALMVEAWRGRPRQARELVDLAKREATVRGEGIGVTIAEYARAVLCNGLGRYEEALAAAIATVEHREMIGENWGLSELPEAATRTGRPDLAAGALERLSMKAAASREGWVLGVEARTRALLSDGDEADGLFRAAIAHLEATRVRAELARTHLLYGEWLRRENRRVDARVQLHAAHEQFSTMGMQAFADRAGGELGATGETVRRREVGSRDDLTSQERQIAELAREGLSNQEIGARLFLSPRTVEWHLRHVFGKLGIGSRRQLAERLPSGDAA